MLNESREDKERASLIRTGEARRGGVARARLRED